MKRFTYKLDPAKGYGFDRGLGEFEVDIRIIVLDHAGFDKLDERTPFVGHFPLRGTYVILAKAAGSHAFEGWQLTEGQYSEDGFSPYRFVARMQPGTGIEAAGAIVPPRATLPLADHLSQAARMFETLDLRARRRAHRSIAAAGDEADDTFFIKNGDRAQAIAPLPATQASGPTPPSHADQNDLAALRSDFEKLAHDIDVLRKTSPDAEPATSGLGLSQIVERRLDGLEAAQHSLSKATDARLAAFSDGLLPSTDFSSVERRLEGLETAQQSFARTADEHLTEVSSDAVVPTASNADLGAVENEVTALRRQVQAVGDQTNRRRIPLLAGAALLAASFIGLLALGMQTGRLQTQLDAVKTGSGERGQALTGGIESLDHQIDALDDRIDGEIRARQKAFDDEIQTRDIRIANAISRLAAIYATPAYVDAAAAELAKGIVTVDALDDRLAEIRRNTLVEIREPAFGLASVSALTDVAQKEKEAREAAIASIAAVYAMRADLDDALAELAKDIVTVDALDDRLAEIRRTTLVEIREPAFGIASASALTDAVQKEKEAREVAIDGLSGIYATPDAVREILIDPEIELATREYVDTAISKFSSRLAADKILLWGSEVLPFKTWKERRYLCENGFDCSIPVLDPALGAFE